MGGLPELRGYHAVLAVKTLRAPKAACSAESRKARVLTAPLRRGARCAGNPARSSTEGIKTMETVNSLMTSVDTRYASAFQDALEPGELQRRSPAVFAPHAHEATSPVYTFISTERVLDALGQAGFVPVAARQTQTRCRSQLHACHVVRLRRRQESVALRDSVPEIIFLNSHDGTTAYQLRVGLFRAVCTNGLIVSLAAFPVWRVPHRGDILDGVVKAALEVSETFADIGDQVERMEWKLLSEGQRLDFAHEALLLRFPEAPHGGLSPSQLLQVRRPEDAGSDLWRTFNAVQENVLRGGLVGRSASGRVRRTRGITAIREDVRLNTALWALADRYAA